MTELTQRSEANMNLDSTQDWFLEFLIHTTGESGISPFGVTLNVGGLLISGKVISAQHYFKCLAQDIADNLRKAGATQDSIDFAIESFTKLGVPQKEQNDGENAPRPLFIHLTEAKFFFPGNMPIPNNQSILWRGMIRNVDGIIMGTLSAEIK